MKKILGKIVFPFKLRHLTAEKFIGFREIVSVSITESKPVGERVIHVYTALEFGLHFWAWWVWQRGFEGVI